MKVQADPALRPVLESWGWRIVDSAPDAILTAAAGRVEIRLAPTPHPDDFAFLPLHQPELEARIAHARARRARLAKRLHDLRSPLNAIQGYAEMIAETAEGDALRFASNIRTASEVLTSRLENFRDEGV